MRNLKDIIQEKFLISKNTAIEYGLDDEKRKDMYLTNSNVKFPIMLDISGQEIECIYYKIRQSNQGTQYYDLYDNNSDKIISLIDQQLSRLFDDKEYITTNTKFGWKKVKYIK